MRSRQAPAQVRTAAELVGLPAGRLDVVPPEADHLDLVPSRRLEPLPKLDHLAVLRVDGESSRYEPESLDVVLRGDAPRGLQRGADATTRLLAKRLDLGGAVSVVLGQQPKDCTHVREVGPVSEGGPTMTKGAIGVLAADLLRLPAAVALHAQSREPLPRSHVPWHGS